MRKRDPNRIEMGRRFREARERLNWSREVLAERADLSVSFIADLELGNTGTRLENFIRLCRLLDLNADYVLFGAPGDAVQRITDLLRDRDEETVRWWSGPWRPCCGPWTNSRQRDRRRPARLAGRRVAHCGGFKEAAPKARPLVMLFLPWTAPPASGGGWHRCGGIWRPGRQAPPSRQAPPHPVGRSGPGRARRSPPASPPRGCAAFRAWTPPCFPARGRGPPPPGPEAG